MKQKEKHFFNNYDAVIFDFDGTIVDLDIDWKSAKEVLLEFLKNFDYNLFLSLDKKKIGGAEKINIFLEKYGEVFKKSISNLTTGIEKKFLKSWKEKEGVVKNIKKLKKSGIKLFIWTLNTKPTVNKALKVLNINNDVFTSIISFESGVYVKPNIVCLTKTLREFNIKNPIYIGDSYYDVIASKKAKIKYLDFRKMNELFTEFND